MEGPKRKRKNTIGVRYVQGFLKNEHFRIILKDMLKLSTANIVALDERDNRHFLFKVSSEEIYDEICSVYTYRTYNVDHESAVIIEDISSYHTKVGITNIPFEVTDTEIVEILENYGKVDKAHYRAR